MNWYKRIIIAQGVEQYLDSLGVAPDIIQYILGQGKNMQYLVNEARKNPGITREQLEAFQFPQKNNVDPYTGWEKHIASLMTSNPQLKQWILVNFRKMRKGKMPRSGLSSISSDLLTPEESENYNNFRYNLNEICDWFERSTPTPDISSYTPEQAIVASEEWHNNIAREGEGEEYEPTNPAQIVYGPEWQNPVWNGWTIQNVVSENDLTVEGNRMNHCVGSYCEDVERGGSIIYSLRDLQNNPHVTIEVSGQESFDNRHGDIVQIKGKSNSEPKEEYKAMIKEWISNKGKDAGINTEINTFENLEEENYGGSSSIEDINNAIEKILIGNQNEYGLKYVFDGDIPSIAEEIASIAEMYDRDNRMSSFVEGADDASSYLVNLSIKEDLKLEHWPRHSGEWTQLRKSPKETNWKNIRNLQNWAWEQIDEMRENSGFFPEDYLDQRMPEEEDYKDPSEYQVAMKMYESMLSDIENEWLDSSGRGKLAKNILNEIQDYVKENIIPNSTELYGITQKEKIEEKEKIQKHKKEFEENQALYSKGFLKKEDTLNKKSHMNWYKRAQSIKFDSSEGIHEVKLGPAKLIYQILQDGAVSLSSLRVPRKYRRQGYAKAILSEFTQWLDSKGLHSSLGASPLDNRTNSNGLEKLYSEFGYSPTGRYVNPIRDKEMNRVPQEID